ncbi:MAG: TonB-dependent receptor [Xanthomonadales bacterium]|nr:TonB-dependent receptor [Xanthomonadales bacterium]
MSMTVSTLALAIAAALTPPDTYDLEEVTIIGERPEDARSMTGSAHVVGPADLDDFYHADIQQILREVPGISVQIEDGYGLRPNISIRGVATERSGRITLLEDGVLIAPAPYAAPSAYYFPTPGRMTAFEVLKGPAAITEGPYTIGGALNMVSTPIPNDREGQVLSEIGADNTYRVHATYGDQVGGFGYLLETHQWGSDGFQDIDRSDRDAGFDKQDYMAKLSFSTDPADGRLYQRLDLKFQYAEEDSNMSYLGLTDADFDADPYRRYGLSELDNMDTAHEQVVARYLIEVTPDVRLTATAYNNEFERNWFKTEGIDFDGSASAAEFDRTGWFNVVQSINRGEPLAGFSTATLQGILDGDVDTAIGSIELRNNAREYYSRGIELGAQWDLQFGEVTHDLEIGVRWHEDQEDRVQRYSTYHQEGGELVLDDLGELGNAGNRVQNAEAVAVHVYDRIRWGQWTLTPGLRYENIDQDRIRYETRSGRTDDPSSRAAANVRDTRQNNVDVLLPGLGALYEFNANLSLLAGVHKGFSAPTNAPGVREEEAINYEAGFRFQRDGLYAEAIAFYSDYDNLLGVCTASSGRDCVIGDAFNGDAASVLGLEARFQYAWDVAGGWRVPLDISYTYIDGEFDSDIADTGFFGDVSSGDPLPYIPENQLTAGIGLEQGSWSGYLAANYVDEVCVRASCGTFERTDSGLFINLSAEYQLNPQLALFGKVENVSGEDAILGRQPYGARPYRDRTALVGFRFAF